MSGSKGSHYFIFFAERNASDIIILRCPGGGWNISALLYLNVQFIEGVVQDLRTMKITQSSMGESGLPSLQFFENQSLSELTGLGKHI